MIYKCLSLFNLLPTSQPHLWLIAADWLEEEGLDVTASAFREGVFRLQTNNIKDNVRLIYRNGYGEYDGMGEGYGHGYGYGEYDGRGEGGEGGGGE